MFPVGNASTPSYKDYSVNVLQLICLHEVMRGISQYRNEEEHISMVQYHAIKTGYQK